MVSPSNSVSDDALLNYKQAASILGLPYYKIQRAAKLGLLPTYSLFNSRKYVKLSDIRRVMSSSSHTSELAKTCGDAAATARAQLQGK